MDRPHHLADRFNHFKCSHYAPLHEHYQQFASLGQSAQMVIPHEVRENA